MKWWNDNSATCRDAPEPMTNNVHGGIGRRQRVSDDEGVKWWWDEKILIHFFKKRNLYPFDLCKINIWKKIFLLQYVDIQCKIKKTNKGWLQMKKSVFLRPQKLGVWRSWLSALAWGARGRPFESDHPDWAKKKVTISVTFFYFSSLFNLNSEDTHKLARMRTNFRLRHTFTLDSN